AVESKFMRLRQLRGLRRAAVAGVAGGSGPGHDPDFLCPVVHSKDSMRTVIYPVKARMRRILDQSIRIVDVSAFRRITVRGYAPGSHSDNGGDFCLPRLRGQCAKSNPRGSELQKFSTRQLVLIEKPS